MTCPLCMTDDLHEYFRDRHRDYYQCRNCQLVFVPAWQFLTEIDEKKRYDLHQNAPHDPDYRRHLGRLFHPLGPRLAPGSRGLDFGSGPGPALSRMFEEAGHSMALFDRFYEQNTEALRRQYDFITATEVLEHLHDPRGELDRLWSCLKPGGWLGIMTAPVAEQEAFPKWYYKNDPTHVCFYSQRTFGWLARQWDADMIVVDRDVLLFCKRSPASVPAGDPS